MSGPELPAAARPMHGDAVPAVVRRTLGETIAGSAPSGLAQSTARLFDAARAARLADTPLRRTSDTPTSGGSSVSTPGNFTVRHTLGQDSVSGTTAQVDIDEIVERVIEKIEQRVVDELERRGRYNSDGAF
jgi:hypothetical protein